MDYLKGHGIFALTTNNILLLTACRLAI